MSLLDILARRSGVPQGVVPLVAPDDTESLIADAGGMAMAPPAPAPLPPSPDQDPNFKEAPRNDHATDKAKPTKLNRLMQILKGAAIGAGAGAGQKSFGAGFGVGLTAQENLKAQRLENQQRQGQIDQLPWMRKRADQQDAEHQREFDIRQQEVGESREARIQAGKDAITARGEQQTRDQKFREEQAQLAREDRAAQAERDRRFRGDQAAQSRELQKELARDKKDTKQDEKADKDEASLSGTVSGLDRLATAAKQLKNHPGLEGITSWQGKVFNWPGGEAANAKAALDNLKSQVAFGVLQDMRNSSKTGGALGAISEKELVLLEANLSALDTAQSTPEFKKSLQAIMDYAEGAKKRASGAFNKRYPSRGTSDIKVGTTKKFPNGKIGKWDGTGWVQQ